MWAEFNRAAWQPYTGSREFAHFHPGEDIAAIAGSPIRAMEDGVVRSSGWLNEIDGIRVEIEIRPGTRYSANHMRKTLVRVGQQVEQGQKIGEVGCTGSCTGNHAHCGLSIVEPDPVGIVRTFLYRVSLFQQGGPLQNDPRIQPLQQYLRVKGPGTNVLFTPPEEGSAAVFCTSRQKGEHFDKWGFYRRSTGNWIGPIAYSFRFLWWNGEYAIVRGFRRRLAIHQDDVVFT
jgi:murein DD-endopeptidase MepM/ murein hydrolase activator NlpD